MSPSAALIVPIVAAITLLSAYLPVRRYRNITVSTVRRAECRNRPHSSS